MSDFKGRVGKRMVLVNATEPFRTLLGARWNLKVRRVFLVIRNFAGRRGQ
jgi:hypothetical protein